jgi:hypothetical protein
MYDAFFQKSLATLKEEGRYRTFIELKKRAEAFPKAIHTNGDIITITPFHAEVIIDHLLESLLAVWTKFDLISRMKHHA